MISVEGTSSHAPHASRPSTSAVSSDKWRRALGIKRTRGHVEVPGRASTMKLPEKT